MNQEEFATDIMDAWPSGVTASKLHKLAVKHGLAEEVVSDDEPRLHTVYGVGYKRTPHLVNFVYKNNIYTGTYSDGSTRSVDGPPDDDPPYCHDHSYEPSICVVMIGVVTVVFGLAVLLKFTIQ